MTSPKTWPPLDLESAGALDGQRLDWECERRDAATLMKLVLRLAHR
jgi:hypothetical protein